MTTHQVGRSHARRQVEEIDADGMTVWLERLNADDYLTAGTLTRYKDRAIAVLKAHRIPVDDLLAQAPGGSMVRDYVLNLLPIIRVKTPTEEKLRKQYLEPTDPLQLEPAARLLEMALHLEAYGKSADPGLVYRFGRLALLFDVLGEVSVEKSNRRKDKPGNADDHNPDRNAQILAFHARLVKAGHYDAVKQTADKFDLSTRQINRIVNPK